MGTTLVDLPKVRSTTYGLDYGDTVHRNCGIRRPYKSRKIQIYTAFKNNHDLKTLNLTVL